MLLFQKIKAMSRERGLTVRDVERACGFGNGTIRRWGTKNVPSVERVAKVAGVFGVTIDELMKED